MRQGDQQVAIVTGGSRGLGLDIARHLAARQRRVIVLSRTRPPSDLTVEHVSTDLSNAQSIMDAFDQIRQLTSGVHILINNAATLHSQYLMILPSSSILNMVETNLMGPMIVAREAIKLMRKNRFGRVVNISSMATVLKPVGDSAYAATKAGLEVFSAVLAKEVIQQGITSNVLSISAYDTAMYRSLNPERVGEVVKSLPLPGFVSIEEVMNAIEFFLSESSGGVTGQTLRLGGVS